MADFLFDIGKVLLDFDFETSLKKLLPHDHTDPTEALSRLIAKKDEFEAGKISVGDYSEWAVKMLRSQATVAEFHDAWRNIFLPNKPMWEAARKLNEDGHRLILFSNTNAIHCPWIFEAFPEFSLFHGSILSYEVNAIKPEPEIYQHAIDKYSLTPSATLYIDDLPQNIEAGNAFGFRSHQYDIENHAAFEQWLAAELSSVESAT